MMFDRFPKYYQLFTELEDWVKQKFPQEYEIFRFHNMDLAFRLRDLELICLRYEEDKKKWDQFGKRFNRFQKDVKLGSLSQKELQQESEILGKQSLQYSELLLLDVDSFFVFARILLDRIPFLLIPFYKGIVTIQNPKLVDFRQHFEWFKNHQELVLDSEFRTSMISFGEWFMKTLRNPRNEFIVHSQQETESQENGHSKERGGRVQPEIGLNGWVKLQRYVPRTIGGKKVGVPTKSMEVNDLSQLFNKIIEFLEFLSKYFSEKLSGL